MNQMERRFEFRKGLHPLYAEAYDVLCNELDPENWAPYYSLRSFMQQDALYAQGRTLPGDIVTNAPAGLSAHEYGCASDWAYFDQDKLIWLKGSDSKWDEYFLALDAVGLVAGAKFQHPDTDHNELKIAHKWHDVLEAYNKGGTDGANDFITESHRLACDQVSAGAL